MSNLCFQPVMNSARPLMSKPPDAPVPLLRIEMDRCTVEPLDLWADDKGGLEYAPHQPKPDKTNRLATILCRAQGPHADPQWWLVPHSRNVALNGVRPLSLAVVEPGDLLTAGTHRWLITTLWSPQSAPAPEAIKNRECPVCGGKLEVAPVVRCPCGRYYHLEKPDDPDNKDALNCYLSGACSVCHRAPSLEPVFLPNAEEKWLD